MVAFAIVLTVFCLLWLVQAGVVANHLARIRTLTQLKRPAPERWPTVTAIVPARDEAATIGSALASRLSDDYPALDVIVVDDRSEDGTGRIATETAAGDPRVKVLRIDELPEGWLGKLNALKQGVASASGEWLLLSDADVHLERGTLRRAMAYCLSDGFDFIALVPEFRSPSFAVNVLWCTFMRVLALSLDPAAVRDPRSKVSAGSGSFMLVRRSIYDASPGLEHLRMETGDDMAFGAMMKRAGARCDFMNGRQAAWLLSYPSFGEFLRGIEKNGGTFANTPLALFICVLALLGVLEYSPLAALVTGLVTGIEWLMWLGALSTAAATATSVAVLFVATGRVVPALLWPLGWLGMAAGLLRSVHRAHSRGGVDWRGTFYSADELLAGQRFKLF